MDIHRGIQVVQGSTDRQHEPVSAVFCPSPTIHLSSRRRKLGQYRRHNRRFLSHAFTVPSRRIPSSTVPGLFRTRGAHREGHRFRQESHSSRSRGIGETSFAPAVRHDDPSVKGRFGNNPRFICYDQFLPSRTNSLSGLCHHCR